MAEKLVHLALTGRVIYEEDITIGQATKIIEFVDALHAGREAADLVAGKPDLGQSTPPLGDRSKRSTAMTPREAIDSSGAKTNAEKIVALAACFLQGQGGDTFRLDSIVPLFRNARENVPGNITRDLSGAIAAGWIAEDGSDGQLYLTARVENVLETGFGPLRTKRSASTGKSRGSSTKKPVETPPNFEGVDIFSVNLTGVPLYSSVKLKRDKLLWATKLAKELGMEGLTNKEIVWLTDRLGDGIVSNDVNGHFKGLQKSSYVNRSTVNHLIRITDKGEEYLKSLEKGN